MEKPNKDKMNAIYLSKLIDSQFEAAQSMVYRNYFALGCWLYESGKTDVANKVFRTLFEAMDTTNHQDYLQELRKQMPEMALQFLREIGPSREFYDFRDSGLTRSD